MTTQRMTYIATAANGMIDTRSSASMPYTHAVMGNYVNDDGLRRTCAYTWHKTLAAAVKEHTRRSNANPGKTLEIVEVVAHPYSSTEAKAARANSYL